MFSRVSMITAAVLAYSACNAFSAQTYTYKDISPLDASQSLPYAINSNGVVTGAYSAGSAGYGYIYNGVQSIAIFSGEARDINDNGMIVGHSIGTSASAFYYDGTLHSIGDLGGGVSTAFGVNKLGHITGYSKTSSGETHAYIYDGIVMNDIGVLANSTNLVARRINDSDWVVGDATVNNKRRGFIYDGSGFRDIGTLGGLETFAFDINNLGWVVGQSTLSNGNPHAYLYDGNGMTNLGTLGGSSSRALAINDSGDIVGYSLTSSGKNHAFIYSDGQLKDLNDLVSIPGWTIAFAEDINNAGQIVVIGQDSNNVNKSFLLTPIPEPSALALLLIAAPLMVLRSKKMHN